MRVLHVPVDWNNYEVEQITPLISRAVIDYPGLSQIVLHFQNRNAVHRSSSGADQILGQLILKITDEEYSGSLQETSSPA
jgi:hypothetical protein